LYKFTELNRFHEKAGKYFLLQNLQKYQKKKARVSHKFFAMNLETNIFTPENQLFGQTKKGKNKNKKTFCKAILPVLTASPKKQ